jgi:hypothetical protein
MRPAPKRLTTQAPHLDICDLRRNGWFLPNRGAYRRGDTITISWRGVISNIDLVSTAMHFGGRREWFKCPACGGRARILYGPAFACRPCQRLNHPSTRQHSRDRAITRAVQLRRSLGGSGSLLEPFPRRPKGIKRKTWWRLFAKADRDEQRGIVGMAAAVASLTAQLDGVRPAVRGMDQDHREGFGSICAETSGRAPGGRGISSLPKSLSGIMLFFDRAFSA